MSETNLITEDDILELAKDDRILNTVIRLGRQRNFTWEETMMIAVKYLVQRNHDIEDKFIEYMNKTVSPPSIFIKKY